MSIRATCLTIFSALILGVFPAAPEALAQSSVDVAAVIEMRAAEYAASYVRRSRTSARFALDTSVVARAGRGAADIERLVRILRVEALASADSVITCGDMPDTCRMRPDIDAIVGIRIDTIAESTAEATIDLRARTGLPRVPIVYEQRKIRLLRRGDDWVFDRELWIEVSERASPSAVSSRHGVA